MALTDIPANSLWTLNEGYGSGLGSLAAGTVVSVKEVCEPGTPGVGHDGTASVLFTFDAGESPRTVSMPVEEFTRRFAPMKKGRSRAR